MKSFKSFLTETVGEAGLAYENKVYKALKDAKIKALNPGDKPGAGFSNQGAGDIEASLAGRPFNIEIKLSARDQMGGTSLQYDMKTKQLVPTNPDKLDPDDLNIILQAAKEKIPAIDAYIKAAHKMEPVEYHKNISGVPLKVSKEAREELKKQGFTKAIATNIKMSAKFIANHYNKKGVYYIQIGGAGLFYMGKNPFKLPVPELKGEIQVELGLRFGGGKLNFPTDPPTPARSAGLRIQGRLLTKGKSKYSLDNVKDVKELFDIYDIEF